VVCRQTFVPRSKVQMWRAFHLSLLALTCVSGAALANPVLGDDVATCRDRQNDPKLRLDACEKLIADGKAAPKDLAVALANKHDYDKAIAAFSDALKSDPDNVRILEARGVAYERKGQDDLAMADYNAALQKSPNYGAPYNSRGTLYLRKGALQSAQDDF